MELNRPITEEDHKKADEEYRELIKIQKAHTHSIAAKLEAGEPISKFDIEWAVAVLRGAANSMSETRKRPKGRPARLPGELAVFVAGDVVFRGKSKNETIEYYANEYQVDVKSIKEELKKQGYDTIKLSMIRSRDSKDDGLGYRWVPANQ
jgi:hypothetical protein